MTATKGCLLKIENDCSCDDDWSNHNICNSLMHLLNFFSVLFWRKNSCNQFYFSLQVKKLTLDKCGTRWIPGTGGQSNEIQSRFHTLLPYVGNGVSYSNVGLFWFTVGDASLFELADTDVLLNFRRITSNIVDVAGLRPATSWGVHYTTSCNTQSSAPEDG